MTNIEKAEIILEELSRYIQLNWNMEEFYVKAITRGLIEIEKEEADKND